MICFIALIKPLLIYKIKGIQFQNAQPGPAAASCLPGSALYNSLLSAVYLLYHMIEIDPDIIFSHCCRFLDDAWAPARDRQS